MSDTLCGPSNALQNFQKHAAVDRTLQQDRLISRQSPSQGFRSQKPSEGTLDPEFAAFESNVAGLPLPNLQHAGPFHAHAPQMPISGPAESMNWATDFQQLHISGPSHPVQQHRVPSAAPASSLSQQGWHNEFLSQQQQRAHVQQHQPFSGGFQQSLSHGYPMHGATMNAFPTTQETAASQQPLAETFDESAFEAAFKQARADMAVQETTLTADQPEQTSAEVQLDPTAIQETPEQIKIGSDTIPQIDKSDPQARVNDADELARTAGQLLDSVSHDQSEKFRQSNFLALMRRIRDREVQIEGDKFRETSQPLHPGGKYYPDGQSYKAQQQTSIPAHQDGPNIIASSNNNHPPETPFAQGTVGFTQPPEEASRTTSNPSLHDAGVGDDNSLYASWNYGGI
ncbi:protein pex20 [Aspergillus clavatus NRRL 1]|uniref:Peroxin 20 n=1 Tax=Aspergillus clavatus (strain ATCC 1007 / CBS 513.65 / DSM 816 / NCTC 3887 / NRRL 1 / QM 1276 / 107) TaxID=344612 RepID=A1CGS1_ASPCL|nr:uncharacterized protein ACLA_045410 [Aspergillus clavatus NRRL 1]EAW10076.1 conserved hypothetical protein [Aspergillus clavatus NRRL 1]